jgi:hypothetical protein
MPRPSPSDIELKTLESCITPVETAFTDLDKDMVHFLNYENFISDSVHDEVLDPQSLLRKEQKAWELVKGVKKRVKEDPTSYYTLVSELKRYDKKYQPLLKRMEYARQQYLAGGHGEQPHSIGTV